MYVFSDRFTSKCDKSKNLYEMNAYYILCMFKFYCANWCFCNILKFYDFKG